MEKNYFILKNNYYLLLLLVSSLSFGQTYSNPGTYSLTFPANTVVSVQVWGGGGAGGGSTKATSTTARGGGGGGAGGYSVASFTVSGTVSFIVGAGGTGVTGLRGNDGTASSFGNFLTSGGGAGGVGNTSGGTVAGGAVGNGNANGTAGNGGQGFTGNGISSGKGGDSGLFGTGGRALNLQYDSGDGQPGTAPGGGGGGARTSQERPNYAGGKGGDGRIIITYCPIYSVTPVSICPGGAGVLMASASCPTGDAISSKFPATATALTSGTGTSWSNPNRIFADDGSNATVSNTDNSVVNSRLLNATGFGFAIPLSATIVGVEAVVGRTASDNDLDNDYVRDRTVQLIKGGTVTGTSLAVTTANWFLSTTDKIYGSQTANMWGTTLLPADVNATNFGVSLSVTMRGATARVDYIKMIVYYTIPGDINWYTAASGGTSIASGSSFNPVGVAGSGLANTNTPNTYTYYASCSSSPGCRTAVNFVIKAKPVINNITAVACNSETFTVLPVNGTNGVVPVGTTYSWSAPSVTGITGAASGTNATNINGNLTNTTNAAINVVYTVTPSANGCPGTTFTVVVTVNPRPTSIISGASTTCNGVAKKLSVALTGTGPWNLTYTDGTTPITVSNITSSPYIFPVTPSSTRTYTVTALNDSKCTAIAADMMGNARIIVNALPVITPNKVNETCSTSNDGSISPVLSGGLSNIRYIKLTQKYVNADAWQQVKEIQAFEIFTETNVALASNGGTATVSSTYQNDTAGFGPLKAIDGDFTGYSFWHSNSTNTEEYIRVDLSSGKNLDKIRIYNRTDCCSERGQNMLLELFDDSNNVLFAKSVDLRGATGTENFIDVNVLDVSWADGATTLNRTGLDSGTYTLNYTNAVSCSTSSTIVISATNITPSAPTIGNITQPTCAKPTGSVILNGLPTTGTIFQTISGVTTSFPVSGGGEQIISGLTAGTYTFTFSVSGGCPSMPSSAVVINPPPATKTWDGMQWRENGIPTSNPTIENPIIFDGNYNFPNDLEGCSCQVNTARNVDFASGHTLKITNQVVVLGTGTLTFEDKASLVQVNEDPTINSGKIIYKRITPLLIETDYTYWSSPVKNQTLSISPDYTYGTFYSFDSNNWAEKNTTTPMLLGKGYIIRGQKIDNTPYTITGTFTGVPNNGALTTAIGAANTLNLIGNPYPSALDADSFLNANSDELYGTIYFWTHATAIQAASGITNGTAGSGDYAYTSDDYAAYNVTGGAGTTGNFKNGVEQTGNKPTGKIASGQAFFAYSKFATATNVTFNNRMRVGVGSITGNNSQFYRQSSTAKTTAAKIEKNRVWLNLTNKQGAFKQALVGYITGATNEYDDSFDGVSFNGNQYVDFYSIAQQTNLTIQGRALPFEQKDSVSLGYKSAIKGEFQISIDEVDGVLATQNIFVEDRDLKVLHDLKKTPYTFNTEVGTFNTRFVLRYVDKNAVVIVEPETPAYLNTAVLVSVQNGKITIHSSVSLIDKVVVYDAAGRKKYQNMKVADSNLIVQNILSSHQVLVVKTTLANGKIVTTKIMY